MRGDGRDKRRPGISELKHPNYLFSSENWEKYRLCYQGGPRFLRRYLKKFSSREDDQSFADRRSVSYVPAFAKAAVDEVKNSIFQRLADIIREGGPKSYADALEGYAGGVDKLGASMTTFMGRDVLPELLTMARVGVYVDMPPIRETTTLAEKGPGDRPYLYWYRAEDIRSWTMTDSAAGDPTEFQSLLLQDNAYDLDDHWGLTHDLGHRYRHVFIGDDGFVHVQFYARGDADAAPAPLSGYPGGNTSGTADGWDRHGEEVTLTIRKIPFVMLEIAASLLSDVADYQVALMNLASSDISYALKSNYPFYVEQYDWKADAPYLKQGGAGGMIASGSTGFDPATNAVIVNQEKAREMRVGSASGRRYPIGTERPGFIHPSSEPMNVSMAKQEQLKTEIRQLVHLAVSTLSSTRQSAESQGNDNQGLEAGLSYIGLELQHAERKIAEFWGMYEGADGGSVNYPTQYSLLSDADRRQAASELKDLMPMVPSLTFRREVAKRIVDTILGSKVKKNLLDKIKAEIDKDPVVIGDPLVIEQDVINGLVDLETASLARGYPTGVVEKAKTEHAERLARIADSQMQVAAGAAESKAQATAPDARGVPDLGANRQAGTQEKRSSQRDQTQRADVRKRTRGKAD